MESIEPPSHRTRPRTRSTRPGCTAKAGGAPPPCDSERWRSSISEQRSSAAGHRSSDLSRPGGDRSGSAHRPGLDRLVARPAGLEAAEHEGHLVDIEGGRDRRPEGAAASPRAASCGRWSGDRRTVDAPRARRPSRSAAARCLPTRRGRRRGPPGSARRARRPPVRGAPSPRANCAPSSASATSATLGLAEEAQRDVPRLGRQEADPALVLARQGVQFLDHVLGRPHREEQARHRAPRAQVRTPRATAEEVTSGWPLTNTWRTPLTERTCSINRGSSDQRSSTLELDVVARHRHLAQLLGVAQLVVDGDDVQQPAGARGASRGHIGAADDLLVQRPTPAQDLVAMRPDEHGDGRATDRAQQAAWPQDVAQRGHGEVLPAQGADETTIRRRGGRVRRCRWTGGAACSSPGPRSDGSAHG